MGRRRPGKVFHSSRLREYRRACGATSSGIGAKRIYPVSGALSSSRDSMEPMTVQLVRDGNAIIALIGRDLQVGIAGYGDSVPEALRDLATAIEREQAVFPEMEPPPGKPVRVK